MPGWIPVILQRKKEMVVIGCQLAMSDRPFHFFWLLQRVRTLMLSHFEPLLKLFSLGHISVELCSLMFRRHWPHNEETILRYLKVDGLLLPKSLKWYLYNIFIPYLYCSWPPESQIYPIKHKSNYPISLLKICSNTLWLRRPYVPISSCPSTCLGFLFFYQSDSINICIKISHDIFNGPPLYTSRFCHELFWYFVRSRCNR